MRVLVTGASGFAGPPRLWRALARAGHPYRPGVSTAQGSAELPASSSMPDFERPFDRAFGRPVTMPSSTSRARPFHALIPEAVQAVNARRARSSRRPAASGREALCFRLLGARSIGAGAVARSDGRDARRRPMPMGAQSSRAKRPWRRARRFADRVRHPAPRAHVWAGPKGNMATLMRLAQALAAPAWCTQARRSLLTVANFADAVAHVLVTPAAAGGRFWSRSGHR